MSGVVASDGPRSHTSIPVLHAGSHFRHGLLQLMIHTIDPLHDGKQFSRKKKQIFNHVHSIIDISKISLSIVLNTYRIAL